MEFNSQLIIGAGQIGTSLKNVLSEKYKVDIKDKNPIDIKHYDILHICFGWSTKFISDVNEYVNQFTPNLVIIHSTVPMGTTDILNTINPVFVNSPVRGRHPHLEEGIKKFVKFFGGYGDDDLVNYAMKIFQDLGIKCFKCKNANTSELAKLLCTTYYGWCLVFQKEVKNLCDKFNVSFSEAYTLLNQTYNDGYRELNEPQFIRPILSDVPGKIGGHCIIPNCEILKDNLDFDIAKFILDKNKTY